MRWCSLGGEGEGEGEGEGGGGRRADQTTYINCPLHILNQMSQLVLSCLGSRGESPLLSPSIQFTTRPMSSPHTLHMLPNTQSPHSPLLILSYWTYPSPLPPTYPSLTVTYPSPLLPTPPHCHLPLPTATYVPLAHCHLPLPTATYPSPLPPIHHPTQPLWSPCPSPSPPTSSAA